MAETRIRGLHNKPEGAPGGMSHAGALEELGMDLTDADITPTTITWPVGPAEVVRRIEAAQRAHIGNRLHYPYNLSAVVLRKVKRETTVENA